MGDMEKDDTHSALATEYHEALKTVPLFFYHNLSYDDSCAGRTYTSHSSCYNAAKSAIRQAYDSANAYFDPENKESLAKCCTKYYAKTIADVFEKKLPELEKLCIS